MRASPVALATRAGEAVAIHDHDVGAERLQLAFQPGAPHDIDRAQSALPGEHDQQPADRRVGDVLDHPVARLRLDEVRQHEQRRRRVDAHHRRLPEIDAGRQRDRIVALHLAALGPVLTLQVDDEVALPDVRHRGADGGDTADAFGPRRGGQRRLQPVAALAEPHVGRIDGKGQHVEHDLVGGGRADIGHVGAARDLPRRSVALDQHLLHAFPPTHSTRLCWPVDCLYCDSAGGEMPDGSQGIR